MSEFLERGCLEEESLSASEILRGHQALRGFMEILEVKHQQPVGIGGKMENECAFCCNEILAGESSVIDGGELYHLNCLADRDDGADFEMHRDN